MGFRFRRSLRIAPGLRLNFSRSGISTSLGGRGATYTIGPRGTRTTVGLPGTGLFWTSSSARRTPAAGTDLPDAAGAALSQGGAGCVWIAAILAVILMIGMCSSSTPPTSAPPQPMPTASPPGTAYFVNVRSANCRSAPAASARAVSGLKRGEQILVSEQSGGWSHATGGGRDCWISSALLTSDPPELALRTPGAGAPAAGFLSSDRATRRSAPRSRPRSSYDSGCPCSGNRVCIGPRGGRYCITSGGNKRYGV